MENKDLSLTSASTLWSWGWLPVHILQSFWFTWTPPGLWIVSPASWVLSRFLWHLHIQQPLLSLPRMTSSSRGHRKVVKLFFRPLGALPPAWVPPKDRYLLGTRKASAEIWKSCMFGPNMIGSFVLISTNHGPAFPFKFHLFSFKNSAAKRQQFCKQWSEKQN